MMTLFEEDFDSIYSTMMGNIRICWAVPWVEDSFRSENGISRAYKDFWTAREHLCQRFGLDWEDADLELFMNGILKLEEEVARRMFLYGIEYAKRGYKL